MIQYPYTPRFEDCGKLEIDDWKVMLANDANHDRNPAHRNAIHVKHILLALASQRRMLEGDLSDEQKPRKADVLTERILSLPPSVIAPGLMLNSILERAIPQGFYTASIETTFDYPLIVPMEGSRKMRVYRSSAPLTEDGVPASLDGVLYKVELKANGLMGEQDDPAKDVMIMSSTVRAFPNTTDRNAVYECVTRPRFAAMGLGDDGINAARLVGTSTKHRTYVSREDLVRYAEMVSGQRIDVDASAPLTPQMLVFKLPRALTMAGESLACDEKYIGTMSGARRKKEEDARKEQLMAQVAREEQYKLEGITADERLAHLMAADLKIYASQSAVFDPRQQIKPGELYDQYAHLTSLREAIGLHGFVCEGRNENQQRIFGGEANILIQPLFHSKMVDALNTRGLYLRDLRPFSSSSRMPAV